MCTLSMVHDHYQDKFPGGLGDQGTWPTLPTPSPMQKVWEQLQTPAELAELRKLIGEFREAVEAAKLLDRVLKQPDCVDPEKAKLQERVDRLEKVVDALLGGDGK